MISNAIFVAVALALTATACTSYQTSDTVMLDPYRRAEISGSTTYRERMMAPPGSIVIVQLQDISRMDAPARTIAEQRIPLDGRSVPVDYRLNPLTSELRPNMRYGVRSEVRGPGGALLWTSDTVNPVNPTVMWQSLPMIEMVKVGR